MSWNAYVASVLVAVHGFEPVGDQRADVAPQLTLALDDAGEDAA